MEYKELGDTLQTDLTIMIFAEGTVLKPKSWLSLFHHYSYIPIGNCVDIIKGWWEQGANIVYCTSRKGKQAQDIAYLLKRFGFVGTKLYYRSEGEKYKVLIEIVQPTVLIEDDCKSIGGAWQMCITNVAPEMKEKIISIVVKEFKGIDNLPRTVSSLKNQARNV